MCIRWEYFTINDYVMTNYKLTPHEYTRQWPQYFIHSTDSHTQTHIRRRKHTYNEKRILKVWIQPKIKRIDDYLSKDKIPVCNVKTTVITERGEL